ncbi:MAG TPA: hypothetical protein VLB02_00625 [Candidatus Paceibacterota bacterium]|nr:hypothetical protein [Candidatus Paceibacterota bacterium]
MGILIILSIVALLIWWAATFKIYKPVSGQLSAITLFNMIIITVGPGVNDRTWEIKDPSGTIIPLSLKLQWWQKLASYILFWPLGVKEFNYHYKKFRPFKDSVGKDAFIEWKPILEEGEELTPETEVLIDYRESKKNSLFVFERDEFTMPFISQDAIKGVAKARIEFAIYGFESAVSDLINFKEDPIVAAQDLFRNWASEKIYRTSINGVSFDVVQEEAKVAGLVTGENFLQTLNYGIYENRICVVVTDIKIMRFYLEPTSLDVIEAQEAIEREKLEQERRRTEAQTKKIEAEGLAAAKAILAEGEANAIRLTAAANAGKIDIEGKAENIIKISLLQQQNTAAVNLLAETKKIEVKNAGKILTRLQRYKKKIAPIKDATEVAVAENLGKTKGVIVLGDGLGKKGVTSDLDNLSEKIVSQIIATNVINQKQGG